jgi:hypothetical protein
VRREQYGKGNIKRDVVKRLLIWPTLFIALNLYVMLALEFSP